MNLLEKLGFCLGVALGCIKILFGEWPQSDPEQTCEVIDDPEYIDEPRLRIYRGGEEEE